MGLFEKAREAVVREKLFSPGDAVIVGLSGGADSSALLLFLLRLKGELGLTVFACHVNHLLRGKEAMEDERAVLTLCRERGVPCALFRRDVSALSRERGLGEEECGREERYACFSAAAKALLQGEPTLMEGEWPLGAPALTKKFSRVMIATAHTKNDSAETLLFNLCRGTGLAGLRGIPVKRELPGLPGYIVRPLLSCDRGEVEDFCRENRVIWQEDSTNAQDRYARNALRHKVLPELIRLNPAFLESVSRLQEIARGEEDFLAGEAGKALEECREGSKLVLSGLCAVHPALRARVLLLWLEEQGGSADRALVRRLETLILQGGQRLQWSRGRYFAVREGRLGVEEEKTASGSEIPTFCFPLLEGENPLPLGGTVFFSIGTEKNRENFGKIVSKGSLLCFDYDKIRGNLTVRQRRPGDRFAPAGRGVTKTLKKLFNEAKIIPYNRNKIPILVDDEGIVAVLGFGVSQRVQPDASTKRVGKVCFLWGIGEE